MYNSTIFPHNSVSFGFLGDAGNGGDVPINYDLNSYNGTNEIDFVIDSDNDLDNDGVPDYIEEYYGTDKGKMDTDGDGLPDSIEIDTLMIDPLVKDTDGNGTEDGAEDLDEDGLDNLTEYQIDTELFDADTDDDGLTDWEEHKQYYTDPGKNDTDGDGVSDGKEIAIETDPLVYEAIFNITECATDEDTVNVSVNIELSGEQVETLAVNRIHSDFLFPEGMPGYIGGAYDFKVGGDFESATIYFQFDSSLLRDSQFDPVIYYYYNESAQLLEPLETLLVGNIASTQVKHFSKYILLNRKVFEKSFTWEDIWTTSNYSGVDVVLIIDDSSSMKITDYYQERLTVAQNLIDKLPDNSRVAVVRFSNTTSKLLDSLTVDRAKAKSYLTPIYFQRSGGTYMYSAIKSAFSYFDNQGDDRRMKMMVVLSDGETSDAELQSSVIENANDNEIKIYTIGLGDSSSSYFTRYMKTLAVNTGGAFYLAFDASQLDNIFKDINKKIDIETDSDGDGIPDYYEDNMVMFNGVSIKLDKYNPDSDGDHIPDGEEVVELNYKYNTNKTQVVVTGRLISNPLNSDTDGDFDMDSIDPHPLDYQLNDLLCNNIVKLNKLAVEYANAYNYTSKEFQTSADVWLTFMFIRQFNSSYISDNWDGTGKAIDNGFVEYVKERNAELYKYFASTSDYYANEKKEVGDLYHLAATITGMVYESSFSSGLEFGFMPDAYIDDLAGWAGDLQTAMNDAITITKYNQDYDIFKVAMINLIGYNPAVDDTYIYVSHTFDLDDMYADVDAVNLFRLLKADDSIKTVLHGYFGSAYQKRYTSFINGVGENRLKRQIYVYTKNDFAFGRKWPLFKYDFEKQASKAARDAFAEFLLERSSHE